MDRNGFTELQKAFNESGVSVEVAPEPAVGEDLHYVEIRSETTSLASLMNALAAAGLDSRSESAVNFRGGLQKPKLEFIDYSNDTATFQDLNTRPQSRR